MLSPSFAQFSTALPRGEVVVPYNAPEHINTTAPRVKGDTREAYILAYEYCGLCKRGSFAEEKVCEQGNAMKYFLLIYALLFLASCSTAPLLPTPPPAPLPTATTILQDLIDEAAEFCPQPRNWVLYVTQPGDTLRSLAERTSGSTEQLSLANCLQNPGILRSGIIFYLPRRPIYP